MSDSFDPDRSASWSANGTDTPLPPITDQLYR